MSQSPPPPSGWSPAPQGGNCSPYQPPGYWGPGHGPWSPPAAPPEPVGSERPSVRGSRVGTAVAWAVILASVAVVVMRDSWVPSVARRAMGEERFAAEHARPQRRQVV